MIWIFELEMPKNYVYIHPEEQRWNMSSSEYPVLTLASCMARAIAFFPPTLRPDFMAAVNDGRAGTPS
jgi:hypothetical protein